MENRHKYPERLKVSTQDAEHFYERCDEAEASRQKPRYALAKGAPPSDPTGDVLVRFAEGLAATDHAKSLQLAGYKIVQELPWAKQAVIVRAASNSLADTLNKIAGLEGIPGVENVEPQMVSARAKRGGF